MQPFQINVQVTIGVSQELNTLLQSIVKSLPTAPAQQPAPAVEVPAPLPEVKTPAPRKPRTASKPAETNDAPVADSQRAAEPVAPTPAPTGTQEYTEVDVRAAMDATRKRIEGENYKEQTDSEGYKTWHRVLTAWFKSLAAECGAEKPSALPDSESRRRFISRCEELFVNAAGELDSKLPF